MLADRLADARPAQAAAPGATDDAHGPGRCAVLIGPELLAVLRRPFPADVIERRTIGGRQVPYVGVEAVIDRLNRAAVSWDWSVERSSWETLKLWRGSGRERQLVEVSVYVVLGRLTLPGCGSRVGRGVQVIEDGSGEDLLKGADSDALKKAASLFGVPLDGGSTR